MSGLVYRVVLERPVQKTMERLPRDLRQRLAKAMVELGNNPRPIGYVQLKGEYKHFRIRVGDWRIIYNINDDELIVLVLEVGSRGGIYSKR
jgi:mRNA interferase RelE/StbE